MLVVGVGMGMPMQSLVLVVQNTLPSSRMGSGSALIAFSRSTGGAAGVSVPGAILAAKIASTLHPRADRGAVHQGGALGTKSGADLARAPEPAAPAAGRELAGSAR